MITKYHENFNLLLGSFTMTASLLLIINLILSDVEKTGKKLGINKSI